MNKKIKIVLLVLILILLILIIRSTYSKYITEGNADINETIAEWEIKVNDTDITVASPESTEDESVTFYITEDDIQWEQSPNISEGKMAPGIIGYFYLRIDPTNTQTALKYTIDIDMSDILDEYINFNADVIEEENGKELHIQTSDGNPKIQRIKLLDEIESENESTRIDTIKVRLEWVDDASTNDLDTKVGETIDKTFRIPITMNVIQYTGEEYDF